MSWYAEEDGRIITNEEFGIHCCNCSAFCAERKISVPCGGDRNDCPHFKEVDTSEYEKKIRTKAIDEFVNLVNQCSGYTKNCIEHDLSLTVYTIHQIAESMKGEKEC